MGSVAMASDGGYWFKGGGGVYISVTEYCVYCDKCGSFKIMKRPSFRTMMWVAIVILIASVYRNTAQNVPPFGGIICFAILMLCMIMVDAFTVGYLCRKCGNTHITLGNVLDYPENARNILDTPYEKKTAITSVTHFGQS